MKTKLLLFLLTFVIIKIDAQQLIQEFSTTPEVFFEFNKHIFFNNYNGDVGGKVWRTDGTTPNTVLFKDVMVKNGGYPGIPFKENSAILNGKLYFIGQDASSKGEIWMTDGTADGTIKVTNFLKGRVWKLTTVGKYIYFIMKTGDYLMQVWKTDGTTNGTELVKDNLPLWNTPTFEGSCNDTFIFTIQSVSTMDSKVWRSNGTSDGTFPITENIDGNGSEGGGTPGLTQYINYNNKLYFVSRYFLYETDGTLQNTKSVARLFQAQTDLVEYSDVIEANNNLYFMFFSADKNLLSIWEFNTVNRTSAEIYTEQSTRYFSPSNFMKKDNSLLFCSSNFIGGGTSLVSLNLDNYSVSGVKHFSDSDIETPFVFMKILNVYTISKIRNDDYFITSASDKKYNRKGWIYNSTLQTTENIDALYNVRESIVFNEELYYSKDNKLWKYANNLNVEVIENKQSFKLYPNPTSDFIQINVGNDDKVESIRVFDLNGKVVINLSNYNDNKIDISKLSQGTYIMELKLNGVLVNKKIVKK